MRALSASAKMGAITTPHLGEESRPPRIICRGAPTSANTTSSALGTSALGRNPTFGRVKSSTCCKKETPSTDPPLRQEFHATAGKKQKDHKKYDTSNTLVRRQGQKRASRSGGCGTRTRNPFRGTTSPVWLLTNSDTLRPKITRLGQNSCLCFGNIVAGFV